MKEKHEEEVYEITDCTSDVVSKHEEGEEEEIKDVTTLPTFDERVNSVLWYYKFSMSKKRNSGKPSTSVRGLYDAPTLKEVVTAQPTEEDYEYATILLAALVRVTYNNYKFALYKSPDETERENFLRIDCPYEEHKWLHDKIFKQTIKKGLDMKILQEKFADAAIAGDILELGEGITILKHDSEGRLMTSVSPINSGLEGSEITFIFSFVQTENYEAWKKNHFKEEVEGEIGDE